MITFENWGTFGSNPESGRAVGLPLRLQSKLHRRQLGIQPAVRYQLIVPADVDDAAGLQHDDAVSLLDGRQSVRNDQRRAVLHRRFQYAGGLVQQQQRVFQLVGWLELGEPQRLPEEAVGVHDVHPNLRA